MLAFFFKKWDEEKRYIEMPMAGQKREKNLLIDAIATWPDHLKKIRKKKRLNYKEKRLLVV